jgi:hypothetical protein
MPSGERAEPSGRTISRRLGVVAEMVIAPANDREEIAATFASAVLCNKVEDPWENRFTT